MLQIYHKRKRSEIRKTNGYYHKGLHDTVKNFNTFINMDKLFSKNIILSQNQIAKNLNNENLYS